MDRCRRSGWKRSRAYSCPFASRRVPVTPFHFGVGIDSPVSRRHHARGHPSADAVRAGQSLPRADRTRSASPGAGGCRCRGGWRCWPSRVPDCDRWCTRSSRSAGLQACQRLPAALKGWPTTRKNEGLPYDVEKRRSEPARGRRAGVTRRLASARRPSSNRFHDLPAEPSAGQAPQLSIASLPKRMPV